MGLYRATLNMPGVRVGKTATFDDNDVNVRRMVASSYLVPVDQIARDAQEAPLTIEERPAESAQDKIRAALAAARSSASSLEPPSVNTAIQEESEVVEADAVDDSTAAVEDAHLGTSRRRKS